MEKILVLTPVYNDWQSFSQLLRLLDTEAVIPGVQIIVLAVNDGSSESIQKDQIGENYQNIQKIEILNLSRNLGHQRAIAIALPYVEQNYPEIPVVVMDSDGEDQPSDIPRLIQNMAKTQKLTFALRSKRSEGLLFRVGYFFYRHLFKNFVGQEIQFGNFSAIPYSALRRLVSVSEIWNNFPAGVLKSRLPYSWTETQRGQRLAGKSQMNLVSLVLHGLSSISVFSDYIGVRSLFSLGFAMLGSFFLIAIVVGIRLFTDMALPGWSSMVGLVLLLILIQTFSLAISFIFQVLNTRSAVNFIPKRDYTFFVDYAETPYEK
jgi:glycosyltransferase involved in cell wall biosynthesis